MCDASFLDATLIAEPLAADLVSRLALVEKASQLVPVTPSITRLKDETYGSLFFACESA